LRSDRNSTDKSAFSAFRVGSDAQSDATGTKFARADCILDARSLILGTSSFFGSSELSLESGSQNVEVRSILGAKVNSF
jgi:hypothetical protein